MPSGAEAFGHLHLHPHACHGAPLGFFLLLTSPLARLFALEPAVGGNFLHELIEGEFVSVDHSEVTTIVLLETLCYVCRFSCNRIPMCLALAAFFQILQQSQAQNVFCLSGSALKGFSGAIKRETRRLAVLAVETDCVCRGGCPLWA